jgi:isocitrate/isopropylmalate dehydrogenase
LSEHGQERNVHLLVLEGDGIGPEIAAATIDVLEHVSAKYSFSLSLVYRDIGFRALKAKGTTFPEGIVEEARASDGVVLGPVSHNEYPPSSEGGLNPSGELRKRLDLFANIRPARSRPGLPPRVGDSIDLVTVRENTEGFYADRTMFLGPGEIMPTPDLALAIRKISRSSCLRIAESAFSLARLRRKFVTAVHKANVLRISDGLFLECTREVAARYKDIKYEEQLVDAMAALLIRHPARYDVIVTTNMFGDILSDEAAEIAGSLGLAASLNAGTDYAVAQAQHGSAPDIADKNIANPTSLIGSTAMLLSWIGDRRNDRRLIKASQAIEQGLDAVIADPRLRTADIGGHASTSDFTASVKRAISALPA